MRDNWRENLRLFAVHRIPLIVTLVMVFLFFVPVDSVQINYFRPAVGVICVYYWALTRGYIFGYFSAFLVGLILDVYSSLPVGVNVMIMMLLVWTTDWLRKYFSMSSFGVNWLAFGVICAAFMSLKWAFLSLYSHHFLPVAGSGLGLLSTVMVYPLLAYINALIARKFLPQERIDE